MITVGERIKRRRLELGYSQEEVAIKLGYKSRTSIQKFEASRDLPSSKIMLMAKVLHCTPGYLMGWEGDEQTPAWELFSDILPAPFSDYVNDPAFLTNIAALWSLPAARRLEAYKLIGYIVKDYEEERERNGRIEPDSA